MKTRNLLLAGLVAVAMSACSNSEDFVDNGNQLPLEKNAEMKINFSFPQAAGAREATGDKHPGSDFEYGVSKVTAVLVYEGTNKVMVTKDLTITAGPNETTGVVTATTAPFAVAAGKATVYAIINKGDINITEANYANALVGADYTAFLPGKGFNYLTETIAKNGNFLMSGISEPVEITTGNTMTATISANRVSAKLDEMTKSDPKDLTAPTIETEDGSSIGVRIIEYAYTNLAENSYVFSTTSFVSAAPLQPYSKDKTNYTFISNTTNNPTYCLENIKGLDIANIQWFTNPTTNVLYKGQVCLKSSDGAYVDIENNFYIKAEYVSDKKTLFKDYASLQAKYGNLPATEDALTPEIMKANGLVQYQGGKCYYGSLIKHTANGTVTADIVRNNWYKLSVNTIKDLGYPTPVPPAKEEDALLELKVLIQPWTIQINNIDL